MGSPVRFCQAIKLPAGRIDHIKPFGVNLDDYPRMSDPAGQRPGLPQGGAGTQIGWAGAISGTNRLFATHDGGTNWKVVDNLLTKPTKICGPSVVDEQTIVVTVANCRRPATGNIVLLLQTAPAGAWHTGTFVAPLTTSE
jgi:hypothetical protein